MNTLFILNDAAYGSERTYHGPRLAGVHRGTLDELAGGTAAADRVLVF